MKIEIDLGKILNDPRYRKQMEREKRAAKGWGSTLADAGKDMAESGKQCARELLDFKSYW